MSSSSEAKSPEQIANRLVKEIETACQQSDFSKADTLHAQLVESAPTALGDILRADAIIEEHKTAGLDRDHLAIWSALYENLSPEETNCLFYSMKKFVVPAKKVILKHGAYNTRLFLINHGVVSIYQSRKGKNVLIAQLGSGDMVGEYSFTAISLCSASVVTSTEVEMMVLDSKATASWHDRQPGLYEKILGFCESYGRVEQIISNRETEKREHIRYELSGVVSGTLLDKDGKESQNSFKGTLANISMVGCCVDFRCSKKEIARALLARQVKFQFTIEKNGKSHLIKATGKIIRVTFHMLNDYALHVQFVDKLPESALDPVLPDK